MSEIILPFLKWAGGKRWLANSNATLFPHVTGRHIEPFAGSAAVFFALQPERAVIADVNSRLMQTYATIRDQADLFEKHFRWFARRHSAAFYYTTRKRKFRSQAKSAAQFVYLNRVCFNGLYRENLKGEFNVPLGSKSSAFLDTDDFQAVSNLLRRAELMTSDFEDVIDLAVEGDFIYVDPPYTTKHNFNGFVKYNQKIFSWADQERLAEAVTRAANRNVSVVVSNADHEDVRNLYSDTLTVRSLTRMNVIASSSEYRGRTSEMVASNVF